MSKVVFVQFYYCSLVCLTGHCNVAEDNQSTYFIFLKLLKFGFWATWPWLCSVEFQTFRTQLWRLSTVDLLASCSTAHWLLWKQMSSVRYKCYKRLPVFEADSCGRVLIKLLPRRLWLNFQKIVSVLPLASLHRARTFPFVTWTNSIHPKLTNERIVGIPGRSYIKLVWESDLCFVKRTKSILAR